MVEVEATVVVVDKSCRVVGAEAEAGCDQVEVVVVVVATYNHNNNNCACTTLPCQPELML